MKIINILLFCIIITSILVIFPVSADESDIVVVTTKDPNWITGIEKNDQVLVIVPGSTSNAVFFTKEFVSELAQIRGFNKAVIFDTSPQQQSWSGSALQMLQESYQLIDDVSKIQQKSEIYTGIFAYSDGTALINRGAYFVQGMVPPMAPWMESTKEMRDVRFKEIIFINTVLPANTDLSNVDAIILGKTNTGEKAFVNLIFYSDNETSRTFISAPPQKTTSFPGQLLLTDQMLGDSSPTVPPISQNYQSFKNEHPFAGYLDYLYSRNMIMKYENHDPGYIGPPPQLTTPKIIFSVGDPEGEADYHSDHEHPHDHDEFVPQVITNVNIPIAPPMPVSPPGGLGPGGVITTSNLGGVDFSNIGLSSISTRSFSNSDGEYSKFSYSFKAEKTTNGQFKLDPKTSSDLAYKSFFIGLTTPNDIFWVNLNPWEPSRLLGEGLGKTEVGRVLLEADLQMKKDFAKYTNPCERTEGAEYQKIMEIKRQELAGEIMKKNPGYIHNPDEIRFIPVSRHWIVPDVVKIYETESQVYIESSSLSIKSDPVYDHSEYNISESDSSGFPQNLKEDLSAASKEYGKYGIEVSDRIIRPLVISDINSAPAYADLRNVYNSLALAQYYKQKYVNSDMMFSNYFNTQNFNGLESTTSWKPETIWENYKTSFEQGEYVCWQNSTSQDNRYIYTHSQYYSSGGVDFENIKTTSLGIVPVSVAEVATDSTNKLSVVQGNSFFIGEDVIKKTGMQWAVPPPTPFNPVSFIKGIFIKNWYLVLFIGLIGIGIVLVKKRIRGSGESEEYFR